MPFVTVKNKYQVVIPARVRAQVGIKVGDLLEAKAVRGKVTFAPKSVLDRRLAEALEDVKQGQVYGPFDTHEEFVRSLHANARKLRAKRAAQNPR